MIYFIIVRGKWAKEKGNKKLNISSSDADKSKKRETRQRSAFTSPRISAYETRPKGRDKMLNFGSLRSFIHLCVLERDCIGVSVVSVYICCILKLFIHTFIKVRFFVRERISVTKIEKKKKIRRRKQKKTLWHQYNQISCSDWLKRESRKHSLLLWIHAT